ncbi:MAG: LysE family translocator [gamma proteobacterium symbiont of Bathyaustriella thionipta]|nr:LysE family translocator [gamma proteobacterium symbiont of Bathyaustriella thionipta]MCU7949444.1 LysE family translocator [gamma proteobacterium symbiont of Bathyaustriella thionipta]MCU7954046.1 LysE family translocator [gamma proteobacterium symbiont of Bathyaustriella thionipta]MCU7956031.1 LysE family translocator [gamma proteobacterium symbiont of Bathyaustriella thionipta]MCU7966221.1 LysE family translocator [gamma proteobacterium symbiont of Bathyaustriella thionipta]
MTIVDTVSLFVIMLTLALIPSTSVGLVITRSVTNGIANGMAVCLGIVLGDIIFILLFILGLSVLAESMGWLFLTIKYMGAAYLIWFGYTLLVSKRKTTVTVSKMKEKGDLISSFLAGFLLTLGDIKAIFFYLSVFPVFVNLEALKLTDVLIIVLVTIFTVGGVKVFYAVSARKIALMSKGLKLENATKKAAGTFLLGAGNYLFAKA